MDEYALEMLNLARQGFYCSQIVVLLGLEVRGEENPALVRALAGLSYGGGGGRGSCGAFTGACCLLGLFAGRGRAEEEESPHLMLMLEELSDWFAAQGRHGRRDDQPGLVPLVVVEGVAIFVVEHRPRLAHVGLAASL